MKKLIDDERLIYKCSKLYYEESMDQQQIADTLQISRMSVSRMLHTARKTGMVQISVVMPLL